jgi:hypothetical protein
MTFARSPLPLATVLLPSASARAELYVNAWHSVEPGDIPGRRCDVRLGYAPGEKGFLILGGCQDLAQWRVSPQGRVSATSCNR